MNEDQFRVVDDREASRYELRLDGEVVGFADYVLGPERILFTYIEVDPAFGGQGLGTRLTFEALEDARSRGLAIKARCPFIVDYIRTHPVYAEPPGGG